MKKIDINLNEENNNDYLPTIQEFEKFLEDRSNDPKVKEKYKKFNEEVLKPNNIYVEVNTILIWKYFDEYVSKYSINRAIAFK